MYGNEFVAAMLNRQRLENPKYANSVSRAVQEIISEFKATQNAKKFKRRS